MLDIEDIETCKQEAKNYIEFMESAGDNAAFARGLLDYINQLEKEKTQNTKLRLQTIPMLEGELKAYKDRVEELKNQYDKDTHILQNQLDKANADKIELNKILKEIYEFHYKFACNYPASYLRALKSDGFDAVECEECSFEKKETCRECIMDYFGKKVKDGYKN